MKTKYKLFDKDNIHQYTLTVKDILKNDYTETEYTLKTSKKDVWSGHYRNTKLIKCIDTGDGIIIEGIDFNLETCVEYDYSQFEYLYVILDCIKNIDTNMISNHTMVKQEPKIK
jgi:hypothetical protein